jgi:PIN like domain
MNGRPEVFFTDRDLGKRFPEILRAAGLTVQRHDDHFQPETPDEVWLAAVGARGWIALTRNRRIRYAPNERDAVLRHGVALLVLVGAAPFPELAHNFVITLPRVRRFVARNYPPFIAKVYRPAPAHARRPGRAPGQVERWYPPLST